MSKPLTTLLAVVFALFAVPAKAQGPAPLAQPNVPLYSNGVVYDILSLADGSVVIGGDFTRVNGVPRSNLAKFLPDGNLDLQWDPSANFSVRALAADQSGNVFVGGQFTNIGGQIRQRIAKLAGSGTGDADPLWNPSASNTVFAIAVDGKGGIFVGGQFLSIGGLQRPFIAKLSADGDGAVDTVWNPRSGSTVHALAVDGAGSVYIGGSFNLPGGGQIAKFSGSGTGVVDIQWNPSPNSTVLSMALDGNHLYIGGRFSTVGGLDRQRIAKVSATGTGAVDSQWNPSANERVLELSVADDGSVYAGGEFTNIGGQNRQRIAKLSASGAGTADAAWATAADHSVNALSIGKGKVYVGGSFAQVGSAKCCSFAGLDASGAVITSPRVVLPGFAHALAKQANGGVVVGGNFHLAGTTLRRNLLRLTPDGMVDPNWDPDPNFVVRALATDANSNVYVGGAFTAIGGANRVGLAKLSGAGTGTADEGWNIQANNRVNTLAFDGAGDLFVGGDFTEINGQSRGAVAKIGHDGVLHHWNPSADSTVYALVVDGSNVYIGGGFNNIGGLRRLFLAKVSANGQGAVDPLWDAFADYGVYALAISPTGDLYAAGGFEFIGGQARSGLAKLAVTGSGEAVVDWNPQPDFGPSSLAIDAMGNVYAGGGFSNFGSPSSQVRRRSLAKISGEGTGALDPTWNPSTDFSVYSLLIDGTGTVYVGGRFTTAGTQPRGSLAAFDAEALLADGFE